MSYYKLKTSDYTFYLMVLKGDGSDTISIGGKRKECVNISINTPDSIMVQRGYHSLDIATIPILFTNPDCSVEKPLAKGTGTITMIRTILSETVKRYPYVKTYEFTDNSHITCDNGKGITLMFLSIIQHKQTWYERHFNAHIKDKELYTRYKTGLLVLQDPELKIPFNDFKNIIQSYTSEDTIKKLQVYYDTSNTFFEFFQLILDSGGKQELCNIIVDWIDLFIYHIFKFYPQNTLWIIERGSIESIQVEETPLNKKPANQFGGKRRTRKNLPMRVNIGTDIEFEYRI